MIGNPTAATRAVAPWVVAVLVTVACVGDGIAETKAAPAPAATPAVGAVSVPESRPTSAPTSTVSPLPTAVSIASPPTATPLLAPEPTPAERAVVIGDVRWAAEVADAPNSRGKGLSRRASLPELTGMLFVFDSGRTTGFWMAGMEFALDLVWISADCSVAEVTINAPPVSATTSVSEIPIYKSAVPTAYTFEVNAGEVELYGIGPDDMVVFEGISGC